MRARYGVSIVAACVAVVLTGCLEHANPFDPQTDVSLSIAAPGSMTVGSEVDVVLSWTPASKFEPHWSYDTPGIVVFKQFYEAGTTGTARVTLRAVSRGTVALTAGFEENSISHTVVVQ
jgi:hypothetical protein